MLRLLIGTGALLMLVGFGAAGWQYWQGIPVEGIRSPAAADPDGRAALPEVRLVTSTGAIAPEADSRAYLMQDRLVPERVVRINTTASLDKLLLPGEKLPAAPYLEVLADIRAPMLAQDLCPILTETLARSCLVDRARVIAGSVDTLRGEARFEVTLAYRQDVDGADLPDLAAHVLRTEIVSPDFAATPVPAGIGIVLAGMVDASLAVCAAEEVAPTCRVIGIAVDWTPGGQPWAQARIAWLAPLPEGMFTAPPIAPQPKG